LVYSKYIFILIFFVSALFSRDISTDSKIQGRLNIVNGASAECVMHQFYTQSGWVQVEGEIGRNGIDGLYYKKKNGVIKDVLVAESKWNTSRLGFSGKGKTIKQMSQKWVARMLKRLQKYKSIPKYTSILKFVKNGQYRARLFKMKPVGKESIQIIIYKIKNKGLKTFEKIKETQLKPININAPKNRFEREIVKAYNDCRIKYLHQYLPELTSIQIKELMHDNYIQLQDIKLLSNTKRGVSSNKKY